MILEVQPELSWDVPAGVYRGTVIEAGEYIPARHRGSDKKGVPRIVFTLDYDDGTGCEYRVHKIYPARLTKDSELYHDVTVLLGSIPDRGRKVDLSNVKGKEACLHVVRLYTGQSKPYITYDRLSPVHEAICPPENVLGRGYRSAEDISKVEHMRQMHEQTAEVDRRLRLGLPLFD